MFYTIPEILAQEHIKFAEDIKGFVAGTINATQFKALRVAHGVYEQRQNDTYMLRIRCASGAVTPRQLKKVAELAENYGNDEVHFTTRQELQIHDVLIQDILTVIKKLYAVGLSTRGGGGNTIRNILTSQDAGISPTEAFDPDPYAMALTTRMIDEGDSWNLPRKFKIAFSNSEADTAFTQATCLGFLATLKPSSEVAGESLSESTSKLQSELCSESTGKLQSELHSESAGKLQKGFKVYCAGGMGARPIVGHCLLPFIPDYQVYHVTRALKTMFDKYGNRRSKTTSRIKFLWKKLEREGFEKLFFEEFDQIKDDRSLDLDIEPFIFPNHATLNPDITIAEIPAADRNAFTKWKKRYVRTQKQKELISIRIPLRLGDLKRIDAELLCDFLNKIGQNTLRCGRNQNIILRNIPAPYASNVFMLTKKMEQTLVKFPSFFSNMINCTGASTCKLGICLPRGLSDAIRTRLAESSLPLDELEDFRMNMSGCPNTCGMHHIAHLGFFGKIMRKNGRMYPGYNVLAGARVGFGKTVYATKYGEIAAKHIPQFVHDFLSDYLSVKSQYPDYYAYLTARGIGTIERLCEKYKEEVPSIDENIDFYTDFGAKKVISLDEIGTAECSAGMFDMIGVDRKTIKTAKKTLASLQGEDLSNQSAIEQLLYKIVFASARMLLVTRGLEGKVDTQIFELFAKHFITAGLIHQEHLSIIEIAKKTASQSQSFTENSNASESTSSSPGIPISQEKAVFDCAAAVETLYQSMDDSLRFVKKPSLVSA
ncbi:sulfite reductase [ferredoxin] [Spirochaetota bacterium]|nr:sulfite reductase [ferredoxin] [Spirochaetota bacterium]